MKKKVLVLGFLTTLVFASCTDAERSKLGGFGDEFIIEVLNCDGTISRTYTSSGKVLSEANTDGYYFNEKSTGKLIEITGNLIITKK